MLAAWLQVSTGTGKSEPLLPVDSELVKIWDPKTIYEVPETGQEQHPEAWVIWKLKQEPVSGLSPSWSQLTRMDLNPGSVCLENC